MKELKIKTTVENEFDIEDIDLNKHLVIWRGEVGNYVLVKHNEAYLFKDIAEVGSAVGCHDSIDDIINYPEVKAALKKGKIKIYEI